MVAELFGAEAGGARGIEGEIGIQVGEKRGIVLLLQMDVREQAIDDRRTGGQSAGLFGGGQGIGEAILLKQCAA